MPKTNPEKLQVKPGNSVFIGSHGRELDGDLINLVAPLPDDVTVSSLADAEVVVLFIAGQSDVDAVFTEVLPTVTGARAVWFAYRKGRKDGITRDTLWQDLRNHGWDANSMVSLSDEYSALRAKPQVH